MKKDNRVSNLSLVEALVSVAWIIIILLLVDIDGPEFFLWGGFIFAIIAFAITFLGIYYFTDKIRRIGVEIGSTPIYYLGLYYVASLILNTIFALTYQGQPNKMVFVMNLILYVIYGSILIYVNRYIDHMVYVNDTLAVKTSRYDTHRVNISNLVNMANTPEVKNELKKLKEMIDYSSNVSVVWAEDRERQFIDKINDIYTLMSQNASNDAILSEVQQATDIWKSRNIVMSNK